jgi:hypothetical protein
VYALYLRWRLLLLVLLLLLLLRLLAKGEA